MAAKKILVTGGAGFIGSHVVDKLLKKGHEVDVIGLHPRLENMANLNNGAAYHACDIRNAERLKSIVTADLDGIIHLAAMINVDDSRHYPAAYLDANVTGTFNLIELARQRDVPKFVYMGTCEVYGNIPEGKADESYPANPRSPYAVSKYTAERYILAYAHTYASPVVNIVRGFNQYGPRQKGAAMKGAVIPIFIEKLLNGEKLRIFGDGAQTRDYVFVKDTAEGVVKLFEADVPSAEIVNLATGRDTTIKAIAEKLCSLAGKDFSETAEFAAPRPGELRRSCGDASKAEKLLGWKPHVAIDEGLKITYEWFKDNSK